MNDLEKAKKLLINDNTLVLVKGKDIIEMKLDGIKPLLKLLNENNNLEGYSLADKIVGKAQAMLIIKANIKNVYTNVLSTSGKKILDKYNISYSYGVLTDKIINRKGDDICPMEKVVMNVNDIEEAYRLLNEKSLSLNKK